MRSISRSQRMTETSWNVNQAAQRVVAAGLAALGATSAIPIALAQLDFAGLFNVFNINGEDSAQGLRIFAGVSGTLTLAVLLAALLSAGLAASGSRLARPILITAAVAGFVTATILWIPAAVMIGGAAALLSREQQARPSSI
jgi:hypothetical protein